MVKLNKYKWIITRSLRSGEIEIEMFEWRVGVVGEDTIERVLRFMLGFKVTRRGLRFRLFTRFPIECSDHDGDCRRQTCHRDGDFYLLFVFHLPCNIRQL